MTGPNAVLVDGGHVPSAGVDDDQGGATGTVRPRARRPASTPPVSRGTRAGRPARGPLPDGRPGRRADRAGPRRHGGRRRRCGTACGDEQVRGGGEAPDGRGRPGAGVGVGSGSMVQSYGIREAPRTYSLGMSDASFDKVTMFGADWCRDCRRSKALLDTLGSTTSTWTSRRPDRRRRAEEISGRKNIPVVVLPNGKHFVEPSDAELRSELEPPASSDAGRPAGRSARRVPFRAWWAVSRLGGRIFRPPTRDSLSRTRAMGQNATRPGGAVGARRAPRLPA